MYCHVFCYSNLGDGAVYCDEHVCLSVCLSVSKHISKTACPKFTKFSVHVVFGHFDIKEIVNHEMARTVLIDSRSIWYMINYHFPQFLRGRRQNSAASARIIDGSLPFLVLGHNATSSFIINDTY